MRYAKSICSAFLVVTAGCVPLVTTEPLTFEISFSETLSSEALDGRVLLVLSDDDEREPRFQIGNGPDSQQIFGVDADALAPGHGGGHRRSRVFGYPVDSLADVPAGEYWVQAVLNRYETFHLGDGRVLKLPPDKGEGQHWERKPGNFYSDAAVKIAIDPSRAVARSEIVMDQEIPPIEPPEDTELRQAHPVREQAPDRSSGAGRRSSARTSCCRTGFDEHPEARYPIAIFHGHFPSGFRRLPRPRRRTPDLEPEYSARFDIEGYNRVVQEHAYDFYQRWIEPRLPADAHRRDPASDAVLR